MTIAIATAASLIRFMVFLWCMVAEVEVDLKEE
jgi:hypothetical protein